MTDRQRLEAIVAVVCRYLPPNGISRKDAMNKIIELVDPLPEQAELAKPEQEPVAYVSDGDLHWHEHVLTTYAAEMHGKDLFTAPPKREWVGLHWEDMPEKHAGNRSFLYGANWAEAKLKEKNT